MKKQRLFPIICFGIIFTAFVSLMLYGLFFASDPKEIPSAILEKKAKNFSLTTLEGENIKLEDFKNKLVVLNFWASWCPPCKEEAVILEAAYQKYKDKDVVFIGIAVNDNPEDTRKAAKAFRKTFYLANDLEGGKISLDYGVAGIPETFFIDRNLVIKDKSIGQVSAQAIETFISGEL